VKEDYEPFKRNILQGLVSTDGRHETTTARRDWTGKNPFSRRFRPRSGKKA
jgi:hypothetical protein